MEVYINVYKLWDRKSNLVLNLKLLTLCSNLLLYRDKAEEYISLQYRLLLVFPHLYSSVSLVTHSVGSLQVFLLDTTNSNFPLGTTFSGILATESLCTFMFLFSFLFCHFPLQLPSRPYWDTYLLTLSSSTLPPS